MNFSLPAFALRRPITVIMLSITVLSLGVIAASRMPLKFLPEVDQPYLAVVVPYPGSTPEQVEQEISIPVEGEFRTIPGLARIHTISGSDSAVISMQFDLDADMAMVTADVRDRIERLKLVLPDDVDRIVIQRFNSRSIPVVAFGLFRAGDQEAFANLLRTQMEPILRRIDGVADVQVHSPIQEKEVVIEFNQDTLAAMNLALAEVVGMLQQSSLNVSLGELADGRTQHFVRVEGEYRRLADIANIIVAANGLRLKDIAQVRYTTRDDEGIVALDGKNGAVILVTKESEANTVTTCEAVIATLDEALAQPEFAGVEQKTFFNQAELITGALDNLLKEGLYGAGMALVVLFLFMHRVRPTIIVALTIPTSLVVALVFMFFAGMSLNLITMVSMIIAVGMLVDNAIVVVENIIRHNRDGASPEESAKRGASEVGLAILAATSTTWVVFLPMYYMEAGQMAIFMQQLGLPLMVALGGSLLIALTVTPLAMSRMTSMGKGGIFGWIGRRLQHSEEKLAGGALQRRWFNPIDALINGYAFLLRGTLRWRLLSMLLVAGVIYVTVTIPLRGVGMSDMPRLDTREINIGVRLEQNYNDAETKALFNRLVDEVESLREELAIKNVLSLQTQNESQIRIYLVTEEDLAPGEELPYSTDAVMRFLQQRLPERLPGGELRFSMTDMGESGQQGTVQVMMEGDDTQTLRRYAEVFQQVLAQRSTIDEAEIDLDVQKEEMQIRIDDLLAEMAGVSPWSIAQTVDMALRGARLPYMKQGGREVPVWAQFREEDRKRRENLDNVAVMGADRNLVPLSQLVEYDRAATPQTIHRVDGKTILNVSAQVNTEDMLAVRREIQQAVSQFELPLGYSISFGEDLNELAKALPMFISTLVMALVLIYLVMAALFESYLLPLSILTSVPMALGGAVWMLYLTHSQFDTITFVGCILMTGVIVNNGIVIVDHINNLRRGGMGVREAILSGGRDRFRPVMMTAITTILGLVPLALATTGGASSFAGLGRALIGGLSAGTLLTLFVVPLFYSLIDDLHRWLVSFFAHLSPRHYKKPAQAK